MEILRALNVKNGILDLSEYKENQKIISEVTQDGVDYIKMISLYLLNFSSSLRIFIKYYRMVALIDKEIIIILHQDVANVIRTNSVDPYEFLHDSKTFKKYFKIHLLSKDNQLYKNIREIGLI